MIKVKKILLIDDDEITNYLHRCLLESLDVSSKIDEVSNGYEGLKYIEDNCTGKIKGDCPYLIFLDINMPVINGFEFLKVLENMRTIDLDMLNIVMLTTSTYISDIQEAANHTDLLKGYIPKPLTEERVIEVLEYISF